VYLTDYYERNSLHNLKEKGKPVCCGDPGHRGLLVVVSSPHGQAEAIVTAELVSSR